MKIKLTDILAAGATNDHILKVQDNQLVFAPNTAGLPSGGTTSQYLRGDGSWQNLNKVAVGLGNVDNTSDANKPLFSSTTRGVVPASGSATADYYLRADGTWAVPPGSGGGTGNAFQWASPVTATGTGASQNITLPESGLSKQAVIVKVNGIVQHTSDYTISGSTLTLTTNSVGAAIEIIKPLGLKGDAGPAGPAGTNGTNGLDGAPGPKGDTGPVGPTGSTGPKGDRGDPGLDGAAGRNVQSATINGSGNLVLSMSDSTTINAGYAKGDKGDKGDTGAPGTNGLTNARRIVTPTWAASMVVDFNSVPYDTVRIVLNGNTNVTFANVPDGHKFNVEFTQDSTGNRTVTLANTSFGTIVSQYVATAVAGKTDLLAYWVSGSKYCLVGISPGY